MREYSATFYDRLDDTARPSAERLVPIVLELVQPRSAVDVGCGNGSWLAALRRNGVDDVLGIDGDWVRLDQLEIPPERFRRAALDQPLAVERRFDLALSLEVAEHLPEQRSRGFVADLCALAPVVLFSAAIPAQGGLNHVNEQWPDYWAALFAAHGFVAIDALRWRIWNDPAVTWWYKQNVLLFATADALARHPALARARDQSPPGVARLVHPHKYEEALARGRPDLKHWLKMGPAALRASLGAREE